MAFSFQTIFVAMVHLIFTTTCMVGRENLEISKQVQKYYSYIHSMIEQLFIVPLMYQTLG